MKMENERFHLYGVYKVDTVSVLIRKEIRTLEERKFHWVNEYPFNR